MLAPALPMTDNANILLVDDQPARLLSYEAILAGLGQNLVRAHSGTEALAKLMEMDFAAILLDVSMPGMDGFETAALIHQHPRFEQTPIIFVTGVHVTDLDRLKGYQMGAVDYVYVPVVPEILRGKVQVLVQLYRQRRELLRLNRSLAAANDRLQAENTRELQKLNHTLEQANAELEQANAQLTAEIAERRRAEALLQEAAQRKDEFLAILAHELRNPLSAIHNAVQLMRLPSVSERQISWSRDLLDRQLKHLTRLIDDLLDVSRITSGRIKLQREPLDLIKVITQAVETAGPLIDAHSHRLSVSMPEGALYLEGDGVRLTQVLDNLLGNAAKYMNDGGSIHLSVETEEGDDGPWVTVRVRDAGVGIPKDLLEGVFELFVQAPNSSNRTHGGLGIGLALVRALVTLHGGTVQASSEGPGQGAEFVVRLPLLARLPESAAPERERSASGANLRILIIDDNIDSASGLGMYLETYGHEVRMAHDGGSGLSTALEFLPDTILLDIGLPDIDGYEVADRLRSHKRLRAVPLVAMTGYGRESDRTRAAGAGFDHYLVKPVDYDALNQILSACVAASAA